MFSLFLETNIQFISGDFGQKTQSLFELKWIEAEKHSQSNGMNIMFDVMTTKWLTDRNKSDKHFH